MQLQSPDSLWHAGIIHMDLKPSNWLFRVQGIPGKAPETLLIDFGVCNPIATYLIIDGVLGGGGAPGHKAPEVVDGDSFGTKADIYSFGVTVCLMLTGSLPFPVKTGRSGSLFYRML